MKNLFSSFIIFWVNLPFLIQIIILLFIDAIIALARTSNIESEFVKNFVTVLLIPAVLSLLSILIDKASERDNTYIDVKIYEYKKFLQTHQEENLLIFEDKHGNTSKKNSNDNSLILEIENIGATLISSIYLTLNPTNAKKDKFLFSNFRFSEKEKIYIKTDIKQINKIYFILYSGIHEEKFSFRKPKRTNSFIYFDEIDKIFKKYPFYIKRANQIKLTRKYINQK